MRSDIKTLSTKALMVVAATVAILTAISMASGQGGKNAGNAPFSGVWETVAGGVANITVRLKQTGNKVIGTYSPRNGKIVGGIVVGKKVTFKWTQDAGYEGTGEFTLDDDGKGFTGSSTVIKPEPQTNSWNTYKPPPPESFAGTWETIVNNISVSVPLTIVQKGAKVTGIYPAQNGSLEGTVDGRNLQFTWESDNGRGSGHFNISLSGKTFGGTFNKGTDPKVIEGYWNGERTSGGKGSNGNETVGGSGGKKMALFAGAWSVVESGSGGGMELAQVGPTVTGFYGTNQRSYEVKDATVNGTILRFRLVSLDASGTTKIGEVIMDPGGKSFKGTIGGVPVTGTLARPS